MLAVRRQGFSQRRKVRDHQRQGLSSGANLTFGTHISFSSCPRKRAPRGNRRPPWAPGPPLARGRRKRRRRGSFVSFAPLGAFQFGPSTLAAYYRGDANQFLNDPAGQVAAWSHYLQDQWRVVLRNHLDSLLEQRICYKTTTGTNQPRCAVIHRSAILMACQFGCGASGKLANYLRQRNCDARDAADGNGTSVCEYLLRGEGYDVSCFAGGCC
jgi:hypothetical protein